MATRDPGRRRRVLSALVVTALLGVGGLAASAVHETFATETYQVPAPYLVAPNPGGTALRMAMVYDLVHGRYPEHGRAWHEAQAARAREQIAKADPEGAAGPIESAVLDAFDDLAVALDRLGEVDEAVAVMRRKRVLVRRTFPDEPPARVIEPGEAPPANAELSPAARAWYRTYANLGTALIHSGLGPAQRGDVEARERVREGLEQIRRSVALNPSAHFGRERWQAYAVAAILEGLDDPIRTIERDLFGQTWSPIPLFGSRTGWGRSRPTLADVNAPTAELRARARRAVRHYDADPTWVEVTGGPEQVPFDEPTLAIIGMWLYGGGPNPHFALSLNILMRRVGQPYIAWAACARALEMGERFHPDAEMRAAMVSHCEGSMAELADEMGRPEAELRAIYDAERAAGSAYRAAQARFEAEAVAEGVDILAPGALEVFFEERGPIASPSGAVDVVFVRGPTQSYPLVMRLAWVLCFAAAGAWLAVLSGRRRRDAAA